MYRRQVTLRLVAGTLSALFLVLFFCAMTAFGDSSQVMRVGWFIQDKYQQVDSDGEPFGYNYEYLMRIAQYTGWEYDFVEVDSFLDSYQMLKNGEIDIMGYTLYSDDRAGEVAYPKFGSGSVSTSLFVRVDSPIEEYSLEDFDGMSVACMDTYNTVHLAEYAQENNFTVKFNYYHNIQSVVDAVLSGEVDAGLNAGHHSDEQSRIVASFAPNQFYFIVNRSNDTALAQLDKALNSINIETPYYDRELAYKYLPEVKSRLSLTKAEKAFVKNSPTIEVSYYPNWFPLSYTNSKTDEYDGVSRDVFERIAQLTGLSFSYTPVQHGSQQEQDSAVVAGMLGDFAKAYHAERRLTGEYITMPLTLVRRVDFAEHKPWTTAISENIFGSKGYTSIKDTQQISHATINSALDAVVDRKADQAMVNTFAGEYLLRQSRYKKLQSLPLFNESYGVCIGVKTDTAPELFSVINKALGMISEADKNNMVYQKLSGALEINLNNIVSQMPPDVILIAVTGLVVIILLLLLFMHRQRKHAKDMKKVLHTDELTGLLSFKGFLAQAAVSIAKAGNNSVYIIDFDINHFSAYNNINGYALGNRLLHVVADVTKRTCKENEICCRIEADHFVVLALGREMHEVRGQIFEAQQLLRHKSGRSALLISYGVYEVIDRKMSIVDMCARALAAKNTIKGNYERFIAVYDKEVHDKELHDIAILERFESALAAGELVHYFQPKYSSATRRIVGAEALVRWLRPNGEVIMPGQFVELLETNGLIAKLDLCMFEKLCSRLSELLKQNRRLLPVSINFSRVHLYDSGFAERLVSIIEKYDVPAALLEIEITETALVDKQKEVIAMVDMLHKAGFLISIDDFGSGFSSLNVLKDMDFDIIKLDRMFLSSIGINNKGETVISSIVDLARKLNLRTVAEGVETIGQFNMLKSCGCDMVQGFYFAKPMPEEEFIALTQQEAHSL